VPGAEERRVIWWAMLVVWPIGYLVGAFNDELGYWAIGIAVLVGFVTSIADKRLGA